MKERKMGVRKKGEGKKGSTTRKKKGGRRRDLEARARVREKGMEEWRE